jgi:Flp pilus assembly secretin CpaC
MLKKTSVTVAFLALLSACATNQPKVIQASGDTTDIHLTVGMATQVEMPDNGRVQSVIVGNPTLIDAQQSGDVVNLSGKGGAGETNLIIRSRNDDGKTQVYQYHVTVTAQ